MVRTRTANKAFMYKRLVSNPDPSVCEDTSLYWPSRFVSCSISRLLLIHYFPTFRVRLINTLFVRIFAVCFIKL